MCPENDDLSEEILVNALFAELEMEKFFPEAISSIKMGDIEKAKLILQKSVDNAESRIQLAAWNELRKIGVNPPDKIAKNVLGMVIEVGIEENRDYLAAYSDHRARYFNYSGAKIIWENFDEQINNQIDALLEIGQLVTNQIGVWEGTRKKEIKDGFVRLSFLTPSGLHFGEGAMDQLMSDEMARKILMVGFGLMQLLIKMAD